MKAVQFGAGNIGRGFLGQLFFESGYQTTFIDVIDDVVGLIHTRREYPLRIVDEQSQTLTIGDVDALNASDVSGAASAVAEADFAATAVGVNALPHVAPLIARGIAARFEHGGAAPLNFIVCENMIDAGPYLREQVRTHLDARFHGALDEQVGFVEASIGRMVPIMTSAMKAEDPLLVCVEPFCELPVDAQGFKGAVPPLNHMQPMDNFKAYVERKLFVHNAGHATTAYLGYLRGHTYIWEAVSDPRVREEADGAMVETCAGLVAKHSLDSGALSAYWLDLVHRFQNKGLGDQVTRVAADPMRKLSHRDRLIGGALMCLEQGIEPVHVAFAAAAAMRYDHAADPSAQSLQAIRRRVGLRGVFTQVCEISEESHLAQLLCQGEQRLRQEGWIT